MKLTDHNNIVLSSLALDLKRVALGLHRKSYTMADRFTHEAQLRMKEADMAKLKPYMKNILTKLGDILVASDMEQKAEDALMYSTLIQNYVLKEQVRS